MPHTESAKKRARQTAKRNAYNRAYKKSIREAIKSFSAAAKTGTTEQVNAEFKTAVKKLDKAAARKVIHPNKAARKKSQLAVALAAKLKAPAPAAK
jgi:small subunit ribosomal protein S20